VDENHSEHGNIFIDAGDGASKTDMANTLGHEVIETQNLQGKDSSLTGGLLGENSTQQQEDLANAFGEQFADRINQAAGGNLDGSGGTDFAHNLKNSSTVQAGTQRADNVGNAGVEHRQLYVAEAKAILNAAPAYAKEQGISEEQAKKDLTQQALLQVDKAWSEQAHIEENSEARAALANIAKDMGEVAESPLGRNLIDVLADTETSPAFEAKDEATYDDTNINAAETAQIESGLLGEVGFHETYATANGEKPVEVGVLGAGDQAVKNAVESAQQIIDATQEDPAGLAKAALEGAYEGIKDTLNPIQDSKGTAEDRQLVAELQGNEDRARNDAADNLVDNLPIVPGVSKVAKEGVGAVADAVGNLANSKISNPLPSDGIFSRVMPKDYAESFANGTGRIGPPNENNEVFIGAAKDLEGIDTVQQAQERLSLFNDVEGTKPNLGGDVVVKFKIADEYSVGLRTPIETNPARGYGFKQGGQTEGAAREFNINNGTAEELGIYDIELIELEND